MRVIADENRVVWSASDLKLASECEFAWARALDAKLGRVPAVEEPEDATLARAAKLGDVHERKVLAKYVADLGEATDGGPGVVTLPKVSSADAGELARVVAQTEEALRSDASVVFQAAFSTSDFVGFADFLRRDDDGSWRVQDTKLARTARVTALMQLAANAVRHTGEDDVIEIGSTVRGSVAVLWVRDTGPGVDEADAVRIFDRFVRAGEGPRPTDGAGLGLAIVASIARAHGGRARVEHPVGGGACFVLELPLRPVHDGSVEVLATDAHEREDA